MLAVHALFTLLTLLPQHASFSRSEYAELVAKEQRDREARALRRPNAIVRLAAGAGLLSGAYSSGMWDRRATSTIAPELVGQVGWSASPGVYLTLEGRVGFLRDNDVSGAERSNEFSGGIDWYPFLHSGLNFSLVSGYCVFDREASDVQGTTLATGVGFEFGKPGVVTFGPMARIAILRLRSDTEYFTLIKPGLELGWTVPWP